MARDVHRSFSATAPTNDWPVGYHQPGDIPASGLAVEPLPVAPLSSFQGSWNLQDALRIPCHDRSIIFQRSARLLRAFVDEQHNFTKSHTPNHEYRRRTLSNQLCRCNCVEPGDDFQQVLEKRRWKNRGREEHLVRKSSAIRLSDRSCRELRRRGWSAPDGPLGDIFT